MITHKTTASVSSTNTTRSHLALVALFSGAAALGFAPIFVRLSEVGPSATAFWRLLLALPALWIWKSAEGGRNSGNRSGSTRAQYGSLFLAGLFFAGDLAFWHWSIRFTSVANATLLVNFAPIFVTLGAWRLFGARVRLPFVLGMSVALAGAALLVGGSFTLGGTHLLGDFLGIVTAVFYAGYILAVKELRATTSTATVMAWSGIAAAGVLLPVSLLSGETLIPQSVEGWGVLIGLAMISHVGGQSLIAYALAQLPAAFSSVGLLVQPLVAALLAWVLLGEILGPFQLFGGVLVLIGILVARRENANH